MAVRSTAEQCACGAALPRHGDLKVSATQATSRPWIAHRAGRGHTAEEWMVGIGPWAATDRHPASE
jgi:hypothetical protein